MALEIIELQNISKKYGGINALKKTSLKLLNGEILSIIGSNGSGKTTLLRIMAGIEKPTSGTIFFDGERIDEKNLINFRRKCTMVFQKTVMFDTTVYNNLSYGLKLKMISHKEIEERVTESLKIVKLQGYESRLAKSLSGGEQQRVALARALAMNSRILFLDEPTANLDPRSVSIIEETISLVNRERKTTIVIATHNMFQAENLSVRTVLLTNGEISQIGLSKEIFRFPSIQLVNFARFENIFSGYSNIFEEGTSIIELGDGVMIETAFGRKGKVTFFIRPEDIILSKERIVSSARNVFTGRIIGINDLGSLVKLKVDAGLEFVVQITKRSFVEMQLNIDTLVFLVFKAGSVHIV